MSDVDTTGLVSEAKTVDLTRYRIDLEAAGQHEGLYDAMKAGMFHGVLVTDTTLQRIADAWKDDPTFQAMVRDDNTDMAALLDGLNDGELPI